MQAYVGGALDLVAVLNENSKYQYRIYCRDPRELFDVAKIVQYLLCAAQEETDTNAMLHVVRYLEEQGDCE